MLDREELKSWRGKRTVSQASHAVGCTSAAWLAWEGGKEAVSEPWEKRIREVMEREVGGDGTRDQV